MMLFHWIPEGGGPQTTGNGYFKSQEDCRRSRQWEVYQRNDKTSESLRETQDQICPQKSRKGNWHLQLCLLLASLCALTDLIFTLNLES